jgi:hypothetical protein
MTTMIEEKRIRIYVRKKDGAKVEITYTPKINGLDLSAKGDFGEELETLLENTGFSNKREIVERIPEPQSCNSYTGSTGMAANGGH